MISLCLQFFRLLQHYSTLLMEYSKIRLFHAVLEVWCRRTVGTVGLASSTGRMDLKVEGGKHSVVATFEHLVPVDDLFDEEY